MERQEILNTIIKIIKDNLYIISYNTLISESTKISDLQLDELDCIEIEIEFEIQFDLPKESCDSFISKSETIKDVIDKISDLLNNGTSRNIKYNRTSI